MLLPFVIVSRAAAIGADDLQQSLLSRPEMGCDLQRCQQILPCVAGLIQRMVGPGETKVGGRQIERLHSQRDLILHQGIRRPLQLQQPVAEAAVQLGIKRRHKIHAFKYRNGSCDLAGPIEPVRQCLEHLGLITAQLPVSGQRIQCLLVIAAGTVRLRQRK